MQEMAETLKRNIVIFNLDPAAEYNTYRCDCGKVDSIARHKGPDNIRRCDVVDVVRSKWCIILLYGVYASKHELVLITIWIISSLR